MRISKTMTFLVLLSIFSFGFTNLDSQGNLDRSMPIRIYWKRISKESQFESLTRIQNKMGYGIKFQNISENKADFQFVSSLDRIFELRKCSDNHYRVFTTCDSQHVEVKSLFIHFKDDSSWFPAITKIDLYGIDAASGGVITESIVP